MRLMSSRFDGIDNNDLSVKIIEDNYGNLKIDDHSSLYEVICTDIESESSGDSSQKAKSVVPLNKYKYKYNNKIPHLSDLNSLKNEISVLALRENELDERFKEEFHRQIESINNLYRLLRSVVVDDKSDASSSLLRSKNVLLSNNWNKMKTRLLVSGYYCDKYAS